MFNLIFVVKIFFRCSNRRGKKRCEKKLEIKEFLYATLLEELIKFNYIKIINRN